MEVRDLTKQGWRLSPDSVKDVVVRSKDVLYRLDASCMITVKDDLRSGPPYRGRDGKFHSHGRTKVVSGLLFEKLLDSFRSLLEGSKGT